MNMPQVYMCSPSWTLLPPPSPYHPSGSSQCTSPKHPVSCMEPGLATRFIHDIIHVSIHFSYISVLYAQLFSRVWLFETPWTVARRLLCPWDFPGENGLEWISNSSIDFWIRYCFPILEWVAMSSSRGSSQPRDRTQVSLSAGRFFTVWITREAQEYWYE